MKFEKFEAVVTSNDDPEKRGRVRIACAGLMGDEQEEVPNWVEPVSSWGWFVVPDVGEIIEIENIAGLSDDEQPGQSSIDNLDLRWHASKRFWGNEDAEEGQGQTPIPEDFTSTNYGKRRGFATPVGHVLLFDDTSGALQVSLTWVDGDNRSFLRIDEKGSATLEVHTGEKIAIDTANSQINIEAPKVVVTSPAIDLRGGATEVAIKGTTFIDQLLSGAIVNTGVGPSSPLIPAPGNATPWATAKSGSVKVGD